MAFDFSKKIIWLVEALNKADVPYAVGGALALGYYVQEPRATHDIDINIFSPSGDAEKIFKIFGNHISVSREQLAKLSREDQVRLYWDDVPVDLFFLNVPLHELMSKRVVPVRFATANMQILSVTDLVICKAIFARSKDWVDIEAVLAHSDLDKTEVTKWVGEICGEGSRQMKKWRSLSKKKLDGRTEFELPTIKEISEKTKRS
ncbi:MAG: hypothetical protein HKL80_05965 [Acidimicrobiales bacterium]|nr:hypothetical protein [Acidimicrobiales bacterium]